MKFLLEFMGCCGSCSSTSVVKEEARLLAPAPELCRVRGRKRGRGIGASRSGRNGGGSSAGVEWRPSLSSICEDNVEYNHQDVAAVKSSAERNLKRKVRSSTPKPRSYSPQKEDSRRPAVHAVMPTFSPAPFMF